MQCPPDSSLAPLTVSSPVGAAGRDATPGPGPAPWLLLALTSAALCAAPTLGFSSGEKRVEASWEGDMVTSELPLQPPTEWSLGRFGEKEKLVKSNVP